MYFYNKNLLEYAQIARSMIRDTEGLSSFYPSHMQLSDWICRSYPSSKLLDMTVWISINVTVREILNVVF